MIDERDLLEREMDRMTPRTIVLDDLVRLHERNARHQRIASGIVGVSIALVGVLAWASIWLSWDPEPAQPPSVRLTAVNVDGGTEPYSAPGPGTNTIAISPDGSQIAFVGVDEEGEQRLFVREAGGEPVTLALGPDLSASQLSWSPDGTMLAFTGVVGPISRVHVVDLETGDIYPAIHPRQGSATRPGWTADSSVLTFSTRVDGISQLYQMSIAELASGTFEPMSTLGPFGPPFTSRSPDGEALVQVERAHAIGWYSVSLGGTGGGSDKLATVRDEHVWPIWSPPGEYFAFSAVGDNGEEHTFVYDTHGALLLSALGHLETWLDADTVIVSDAYRDLGTVNENETRVPSTWNDPGRRT